jgi:cytochrome c oxidase cbb3-type subunit 1
MRTSPLSPESGSDAAKQTFALERALIDESARWPVLFFFATSLFWLLVGTLFALIASYKLHSPEFLSDAAWLTFGRVRPAHLNAVAYGWVSLSSFGIMLWLMARLSRAPIQYPGLLIVGGSIWNLGVLVGIIGILAGQGTSIEWLEFPAHVPPILVAGYAFIGTWAIATFRLRREQHVYVSQWYLMAALFWLPWLYTVANLLLLYAPLKGVTQATVNWWFGHNWLGLWVTPVGLASAYYLIPKVYGRPVYSYYLSILGFWALALFYNWAGMHHLVGGPIPAWMVAASAVGSMMMLIPVGAVAINHHMTAFPKPFQWDAVWRSHRILWSSPTLRFIIFGAVTYTLVSVQGAFQALPNINRTTHFTHYTIAHAHLGLYGFYTMIAFGSMYYIVPRLTGWEWASARLIKLHFWSVVIGFYVFYFAVLTVGGWYQGRMLNSPVPKELFEVEFLLVLGVLILTVLTFLATKLIFWTDEWGRPLAVTLIVLLGLGIGARYLFLQYPRDPDSIGKYLPFIDIVRFTIPYLKSRTLGGVLMAVGHVAFVTLFVLNVLRKGERRQGPTLLDARELPPEPAEATAPAAS